MPGGHRVCAERACPPSPGGQSRQRLQLQPGACTMRCWASEVSECAPGAAAGARRGLKSPRAPQEPVSASLDGTLRDSVRLPGWGGLETSEMHPKRGCHLWGLH